jgi:hypothetical protein
MRPVGESAECWSDAIAATASLGSTEEVEGMAGDGGGAVGS